MKHDELCAIAHNLVDSIASGASLVTGHYEIDVFGETARSRGNSLQIDLLSGRVLGGQVSESLARTAILAKALTRICQKHGASVDDFAELSATFSVAPLTLYVTIAVTDRYGKRSQTDYMGNPLKRVAVVDPLGRIRRTPRRLRRAAMFV